jgi:ATP-dependent DNA helicase RecG
MINKLREILTKEQERDCDDRLVMGGLEALVLRWRTKGEGALVADEKDGVQQALKLLEGYSSASLAERQRRVGLALQALGNVNARDASSPRSVSTSYTTRLSGPAVSNRPKVLPSAKVDSSETVKKQSAQNSVKRPRPGGRTIVGSATASATRKAARAAGGLDGDVRGVWGISEGYASKLRRLGVETIRQLLQHFPRRYVDYSSVKQVRDLRVGEVETVQGTVWEIRNSRARSGLTITSAVIADNTGTVHAVWFNQPFLTKNIAAGKKIVLSGKVEDTIGRLQLKSPDWEIPGEGVTLHTGRLVPTYPLTEGLSDRWMRSVMRRALDKWLDHFVDHLPVEVREGAGLIPLSSAIEQIHFPGDSEILGKATRRLAFDEFFILQLAVLNRRRDWQSEPGNAMPADETVIKGFLSTLPFSLTQAQRRVLGEILADMKAPNPMVRLLQGEVGSGKTIVATAAALVAAHNGFQVVLMAPTEILAEQHFRTIKRFFGVEDEMAELGDVAESRDLAGFTDRHLRVGLLTGSVKKNRKAELYQEIAGGTIDIVVGTHALIQDEVSFEKLGLVIVDEQHRFGVNQRASLRQKGYNPDILVMTATPIPRTLAMTVYGDLDLSIIDELPPGRQEIKTIWLGPDDRPKAYAFLHQQVAAGRQGFVICPLVEESEKIEAKAAIAEYERLRTDVLPDLRLGLLHGRMKGQEKESVMTAFNNGDLDVLVSTAVVEVGIDVPNATVMLIEAADRFGLAQLHQFRGRVGRGSEKSYCLLLADSPSALAEQRLMAIAHTQDGFALAEEDLRLRGPGEFFGLRQSGLPDLKVAQFSDLGTLQQARDIAQKLFAANPLLEGAEYHLLREKVDGFLDRGADLDS